MSDYSKIAEEEFQKLPLEEKEKLVSVVQTWNKAFECGVLFAMKNAKELLKQMLQTSKASGCDNINILTDTEQFLKESE